MRKGFAPIILLVVVVVVIVAGLVAWYVAANKTPLLYPDPIRPVACTQEAKQCPDGSYVGRTGPDCAFAACPGGVSSTTATVTTSTNATSSVVDTSNWKTYTNQEYGYSFQYPSFVQDITESGSSSPLCELSDGNSISCFEYPPQELPGIVQFAGGAFVVNITDATSSQACDDFSDEGWGALPAATSSINGVEFYSGGNPDAWSGAGHTEEGIEYRAYHNSMCYDLQANIGTDRCDGTETTDPKLKFHIAMDHLNFPTPAKTWYTIY